MFRYVTTIVVAILLSAPLKAGVTPFPASFHTQMVPTNGTSLFVRVGGEGSAVVLLHGFGFTGDMWAPGNCDQVCLLDLECIHDAGNVDRLVFLGVAGIRYDAFEQFGAVRQDVVASNVTGGIVPDSGHWIMVENPQATIKLATDFLAK